MIILFLTSGGFPAYAQFYPYPFQTPVLRLNEVRTRNFRFIFSDDSRKDALRVAAFAEEEYSSLVTIYGPLQNIGAPIRVVLSRDSQTVNGFTSPVGAPGIQLYTFQPADSSSSIANFGPDPLRTMFRHELAHLFTISLKAKGAPRFDYFLGNICHPNAVFGAPLLMEGASVSRESDGGYGRLKDPFTYHLLRRDFYGKKQKLRSPARVSGADRSFDTGHLPYTYGALFYQYLSTNFTDRFDSQIWNELSRWKTSSLAVPDAVQDSPSQRKRTLTSLWSDFEGYHKGMLPPLEEPSLILSRANRRIGSLTLREDRLYYYDLQRKELRRRNLSTGQDSLILYGNNSWDKVHVSPDETLALVSGTAYRKNVARVYVALISLKTKMRVQKPPLYGLKDASFAPYADLKNPAFTAIRIEEKGRMVASSGTVAYKEAASVLVYCEDGKIFPILTSTGSFFFDSPIIYGAYVYSLASVKGRRSVIRTLIDGSKTEVLEHPLVQFPRFLTESPEGLTFAYAESLESLYKAALISGNTLVLFKNNLKGEMLRSVFRGSTLYVQGSFGSSDNISQLPFPEQKEIRPLRFRPLPEDALPPPPPFLPSSPYKQAKDMIPYFWTPFASFTEAGIQTLMFDPAGADTISLALGIDYYRATPQFRFQWLHSSLPVDISLQVQNRYLEQAAYRNHLVAAGVGLGLPLSTAMNGSGSLSASLFWMGRFTGDGSSHPYTWAALLFQQLVFEAAFHWSKTVSEGRPFFERSARITLRSAVDTINPYLWRVEGGLKFSPPLVPIFLNLYGVYDRGGALPSGSSFLGASLIPVWQEYANLTNPSLWAVFGSLDLLLIPGEINQGIEMGEIFLHSINVFGGYRAGWWQAYFYLQSVYLRLDITLSVFYGGLTLTLSQDFSYAISRNNFSYYFSLNAGLPF